jgi:hypothetical protein
MDLPSATRTPLVGRDRELGLLRDALARVRAERAPRLITLVGVPGIGKSRLVWELRELVEADPDLIVWRLGRCLPYGDGVALWALGEIVKAQTGILETDPADVAAGKLTQAVADLLPTRRRRPGWSATCEPWLGWSVARGPVAGAARRRSPPGGGS